MGKATIVSGGTAGFYTVTYHYDTTKALARKAALEAEKAEINATEKPALEANITTTNTAINNAVNALNAVIPGYPATVSENELLAYQDAILVQRSIKNEYERQLNALKVRLASIDAEISRLSNLVSTETRAAWCADYSESLTGVIGTIEVNGDTNNIILRPGYTSEAWDQARDGMAQQAAASPSAAQTFYNWAMRAGWQKWKPRHQIGTITAKTNTSGSTYVYNLTMDATVALDHPDGANLSTTQASTLVNVAATYECGSGIYELGDRVVVEFTGQNWNTPTIIGFESSPRICGYKIRIYDYDGTTLITPDSLLDLTGEQYNDSGGDPVRFVRITLVNATTLAKRTYVFRDGNFSVSGDTYTSQNSSGTTFSSATGYFTCVVDNNDLHHIFVACTHRVFTQYPDKWEYADMHPFASLSGYPKGAYDVTMRRFARTFTTETQGYLPPTGPPYTSVYDNIRVYTSLSSYTRYAAIGAFNPGDPPTGNYDTTYSLGAVSLTLSPGPGSRSDGSPFSFASSASNYTATGSLSGVLHECYTVSGTSGPVGVEGVSGWGTQSFGGSRDITVAPVMQTFSFSGYVVGSGHDC